MRLFLATTPGEKKPWLRTILETVYGPALPIIALTPETPWANLPARCLIETHSRPDADLLGQLRQHGFKILSGGRHPLDELICHSLSDGIQPDAPAFVDYAVSAAAHGHLLFALEWAGVDGSLSLRYENWFFSRVTEMERLRQHCGEFTQADASSASRSQHDTRDEPDSWCTHLTLKTALVITDAHAGLFAALGYFPPVKMDDVVSIRETSLETKRLRHQLTALHTAQLRLQNNLHDLHKNRAATVTEIGRLRATIEAEKAVTRRYHNLVHGVGFGKHLYRAWQVLIGNRHYRQPPPVTKFPTDAQRLPDQLKGYQTLTFGHLEVRFHLEALHDNRGTGRVARHLLAEFQALEEPLATSSNKAQRRVIHFFAAPHWGPEELPAHSCVIIHDVIPSLNPGYPPTQIKIFEQRCRSVIQQAEKIITISDSSARDISRVLDYPEDKITVIHNGVTRLPVADAPAIKLPTAPFVVYVGGGDSHKNIDVLLEALRLPAARHVHLVMVGENFNYSDAVASLGLHDRVHFLGRIPDGELGYVLKNAAALVFPSYYEGFGLPPLEAALLGTPSICSRRPAMTELLAGAAVFADHESADDWARCLYLLTTSPHFSRAIGQLAQARAGRLQWSDTARAYLNVLQTMA